MLSEQRSTFLLFESCVGHVAPCHHSESLGQTTELPFWDVLCSCIIYFQSIYMLCPYCTEISTAPSWLCSTATKDETWKTVQAFQRCTGSCPVFFKTTRAEMAACVAGIFMFIFLVDEKKVVRLVSPKCFTSYFCLKVCTWLVLEQ
jgi:hypothetical protein